MTNPNAALYEEIIEDFNAKPTYFSATEDLANMERALIALNSDPTIRLVRYHSWSNMPTFVYEILDKETWILIDRISGGRTKIVVRSTHSLDAVSDAIALASGIGDDDAWESDKVVEDSTDDVADDDLF